MLKKLREIYIGFIVSTRAWLDLYKSRRTEEARLRVIAKKTGKHEDWQKVRAMRTKKRHALAMFRKRRRQREAAETKYDDAKTMTDREKAIAYAPSLFGEFEKPAGSNRGGRITGWQRSFGSWLVGQPWCGVFVGVILRHVGVKVTSRIAGVANIEDDAKAGRNGFKHWHASGSAGRAGDVGVAFGRGVHTFYILEHDRERGGYWTAEGNTSPGTAGSQSNGGCSTRRFRTYAETYGIAVPNYPDGS